VLTAERAFLVWIPKPSPPMVQYRNGTAKRHAPLTQSSCDTTRWVAVQVASCLHTNTLFTL